MESRMLLRFTSIIQTWAKKNRKIKSQPTTTKFEKKKKILYNECTEKESNKEIIIHV
jgi:hypothetical protein